MIGFGRSSKKNIYQIGVVGEGESKVHVIPRLYFRKQKAASTYAGIETIAGMGESYHVIKKRIRGR